MTHHLTQLAWGFELRIPYGSADGNWVVFDAESDNSDTVAIIDPGMICDDLVCDPKDYARLIAAAPSLLRNLQDAVAAWEEQKLDPRQTPHWVDNARYTIARAAA